MSGTTVFRRWPRRGAAIGATAILAIVALAACSHLMMMVHGTGAERPAHTEFGFGPRSSAGGMYRATVEPAEPIRTGKLHGWMLQVEDGAGAGVDGAEITVDGGMPEHGHGLPTKPRVTRGLGGGAYEVAGMKFNMGGWWEVRFRIAGPAGTDSVTFNLDL